MRPFIKSTDSWEAVVKELKRCGWTEPSPGLFLKPGLRGTSMYLSGNEVQAYGKANCGWGARHQRLHTKPSRIAECVSEPPASALNATLPGNRPNDATTAEDDGENTEVGIVADGAPGCVNSKTQNAKINKFDDWATVSKKLGVRVEAASSSFSGYHYVIGKPSSEGGVDGVDFFQTQATLQDYCKPTYGWYGAQGGMQPQEGRVVRLSPDGQTYVESIPGGLVADFYAVWRYEKESHSCTVVPIEKAGKFDVNNPFDTSIAGRDKWVCVSDQKCRGFKVDAELIEVVVEADRVISRSREKQDDLSCDEWNMKGTGKDGKKRSASSRRDRSQKAPKMLPVSSPTETSTSPSGSIIHLPGAATKPSASLEQTSSPSPGDNAFDGLAKSSIASSEMQIPFGLSGGPLSLLKAIVKKQKEIVPELSLEIDASTNSIEVAVAYVLTKLVENKGPTEIAKCLDVDASFKESIVHTITKIKGLYIDGESCTSTLNSHFSGAVFKLRGNFESLRAEPDAELSIRTGENLSPTPKASTSSTRYMITPPAAAASPGSTNIASRLEDDALACPITLELPQNPVIGVHGNHMIGTIYDRQALEDHWDTQRDKGHDLTWPTTNEVIKGKPFLVSSTQLQNAVYASNAAQEELQQERAKRHDLMKETEAMRETAVRLEDEVKDIKGQLIASKADAEKAKKDNADLEKKMAFTESKNKVYEENDASLNEKLSFLTREEARLQATIRGLSAEYLSLESVATKAIASSLGTTLDLEADFNVADLKGHFDKCKAIHNFLRHLPIDWPSTKIPLVEVAKHLLDSLHKRHAPNVEVTIQSLAAAGDLARKCRLIHLILTNILEDSDWSDTDKITLKMIIDHIPLPEPA